MNEVGNICKAVAVVSVISGIITSLLPSSKLTNAINTLSAIIIIYAMIFSFSDTDTSSERISDYTQLLNISDVESAASDMLIDLSEKELKDIIDKALSENEYNCRCEVEIIYKENEPITEIIRIMGEFNENDKKHIKSVIKSKLERSVDIEFSR